MKNIFVLPTDKPSRLYLSNYGKELNLSGYPLRYYTTGQNIYITSDEEIKKGDWFINDCESDAISILYKCLEIKQFEYIRSEFDQHDFKDCKKIILTTDQDLDGVQAIPDEFLEWFIKNSSCEEVEVVIEKFILQHLFKPQEYRFRYKIIIPKKNFYCGDKVDYDEQCNEQCSGCVDAKGVDYGYL